ncbi:hypothetical protein, partial [Victivallis vadensis]
HPAAEFKPTPVKAMATVRTLGGETPAPAPVTFDGNFGMWPEPVDNHHALQMTFKFKVPADGRYCVMFNTKSQSVVKVDGELAFRREPGSMAPSFHRAPWNQSAMLDLKQGVHVLEAEMTRVPEGQLPNWVVGVACGDTMQWVPDAFLNVE